MSIEQTSKHKLLFKVQTGFLSFSYIVQTFSFNSADSSLEKKALNLIKTYN